MNDQTVNNTFLQAGYHTSTFYKYVVIQAIALKRFPYDKKTNNCKVISYVGIK